MLFSLGEVTQGTCRFDPSEPTEPLGEPLNEPLGEPPRESRVDPIGPGTEIARRNSGLFSGEAGQTNHRLLTISDE